MEKKYVIRTNKNFSFRNASCSFFKNLVKYIVYVILFYIHVLHRFYE